MDVVLGDLHDFSVRPAIHGIVTNGAAERHRLAGFLGFEKSVDVDGHIRLGQILAVQTAAGHGVGHIRAEFAVGSAGVHIGAARPVTERVDFRIGINLAQMLCLGIALTENEPVAVQNVLPVKGIHGENIPCDLRELFLFPGHGHSLENAVVAAADAV